MPESVLGEWQDEVRAHVARQVAQPASRLLISSEALSLLRSDDEVAALRDLLRPRQIQLAVCLRDPSSFLESYRYEMAKKGIAPSRYRSSHDYVEPDAWLVRRDEMLSVRRRVLGAEAIVDFGYQDAMAEYHSSIPGVLAALSIDQTVLPSLVGVTANTRPRPERSFGIRVARRLNRFHSAVATIGSALSWAGSPFHFRNVSPLEGYSGRFRSARAQFDLPD